MHSLFFVGRCMGHMTCEGSRLSMTCLPSRMAWTSLWSSKIQASIWRQSDRRACRGLGWWAPLCAILYACYAVGVCLQGDRVRRYVPNIIPCHPPLPRLERQSYIIWADLVGGGGGQVELLTLSSSQVE